MKWIFLVLLYGLLKGSREIAKKKAMGKNSVMEVLVTYTNISFIFVIPQAPKAGGLELKFFFYIAIKSFAIFLAWICSFHSLKKLPVSLYGVLDLSRVLFATFFGVAILGETLSLWQIVGLVTVCSGLLLLKFKPPFLKKLFKISEENSNFNKTDNTMMKADARLEPAKGKSVAKCHGQQESMELESGIGSQIKKKKEHSTTFYVILALISCLLNAVSGFLDKVLMKDISSSQLQFWYMVFLVAYYLIYILITREKISWTVLKNWWIWLLAIMFVIGDKALFIANGMPESKITVMTLIKQAGCLVTILGGRFIFKEKNTGYKFFCAAIIITGIVLGVAI